MATDTRPATTIPSDTAGMPANVVVAMAKAAAFARVPVTKLVEIRIFLDRSDAADELPAEVSRVGSGANTRM
jgi:hypothetical protein